MRKATAGWIIDWIFVGFVNSNHETFCDKDLGHADVHGKRCRKTSWI
jgi:hypothetical protein